MCRLTKVQKNLYNDYIQSDVINKILKSEMEPFAAITHLRKVINFFQ